jgi:hypothetical protein
MLITGATHHKHHNNGLFQLGEWTSVWMFYISISTAHLYLLVLCDTRMQFLYLFRVRGTSYYNNIWKLSVNIVYKKNERTSIWELVFGQQYKKVEKIIS